MCTPTTSSDGCVTWSVVARRRMCSSTTCHGSETPSASSTCFDVTQMETVLPKRAQVVVVGGGVVGCSVAYHLARRGWTDVVMLERNQLTSGTTWHAAGLITTARPTSGMRR